MIENDKAGFDVAICGGSFVGLALAKALAASLPGAFKIAIVEQRPLAAAREGAFDGRSAALTSSAKAMLEVIGVWPALADKAEPVRRIELTDSPLESAIRTPLLGLDASDAPGGEPTSYIVGNADFREALVSSLDGSQDVAFFAPESVEGLAVAEQRAELRLRSGATLRAKLVVAADGQQSKLRELAGIQATVWRSGKMGIVATVGTERPHNGVARQHFLSAGPFAILPMTGNRVSIVWTEEAAVAERLLSGDPSHLQSELERRFGSELGAVTLLSRPQAYPLSMTLAREFVRPRFALAGDAAHGLHWIAGQGLNHGLKDVAALAETVIDAARLGLDIGSLTVLKRYERWRRFDSATSAFTAAALNRLFSNDNIALRMVRSAGLRTLDRIGRLKAIAMKEAAGLTGDLPKLLMGQPV
jgi:2-octaprenyl-6-methoxyphenol hydroxylase